MLSYLFCELFRHEAVTVTSTHTFSLDFFHAWDWVSYSYFSSFLTKFRQLVHTHTVATCASPEKNKSKENTNREVLAGWRQERRWILHLLLSQGFVCKSVGDFKKPPRRVGENKRSYVDGLNVFWAAPRSPASLSPNSHHKRLTWTLNTCHFLFFPTNRRIYQNTGSNLAGAILTSIKHCLVYLFISSFTDILPASEMCVDYKERHKKRIFYGQADRKR